ALHAIGFVALAGRSAGQDLVVELAAPLSLDGKVPVALASRVVETTDGEGAGLRRKRWRVSYRGGFAREVGATQLVGPFQDPDAPACSGRVIVGQQLLDDGIAPAMQKLLDAQLRGEEIFPVGKYRRIDKLTLEWARFETHVYDAALLGAAGAPHGYLRASARIVFDRVTVPLVLAAIPEQADTELHFRVHAFAQVEVANGILQWLNSKVDLTSKLATRLANHELDAMLVTALAPPPPFDLDKAQQLAFTFCNEPVEIRDRASGTLPFAVRIGRAPAKILPPRIDKPATAAITGPLAIELDVDALNAILYELWRTGWLDRRLAAVGLDRRFNADATVQEYLTVRLSPLRLALPPVISPAGDHLRLAADARVNLDDHGLTVGRVYGALDFRFAHDLTSTVKLGALELACERSPTTLVPCYADLVDALATRSADFDGALTTAFVDLLRDIFVDRELATGDLPGVLRIRGVVPTLLPGASGVHLELDAKLIE
ncbi:MAG: hypothetical protein ABI678_09485, partial [Kofleriaceae bacterium]